MDQVMLGVMWYLIFLLSTTMHEAAHAWAARRLGDSTAYDGGQVSLDPWPHIQREPIGMVAMPILGLIVSGFPIGWASAPYDPEWADRYPRRAGLMAIAGPAANLLLVLVAALAIRVGLLANVFEHPGHVRMSLIIGAASDGFPFALARTLSMLFSLNLLLATFNMLPLPPLDGSAALGLVMHEETARKLRAFTMQPGLSMLGLVFAWQIFGPMFRPIFSAALDLLYTGTYYG
jgi:Zn-dependent protease